MILGRRSLHSLWMADPVLSMRSAQVRRCTRGRWYAWILIVILPCLWPQLYSPLGRHMPTLFSEWEAPKARYQSLLDAVSKFRLEEEEPPDLWSLPDSRTWGSCIYTAPEIPFSTKNTTGYLQVFLEGGLNQQRMAICDSVAVAKLLNAILVIPQFDINPFWQDSSSFADIFDVDHFIETLKTDLLIVKELPREYWWSTREYYATGVRATRVKNTPTRAPPSWFLANVLPVMHSYGIAAVVPFSHRLAYDGIPQHIQQLRCKVNFHALRYISQILLLGDAIVGRLRTKHASDWREVSTDDQEKKELDMDGAIEKQPAKFVALHLRFDKDMAAHSSCDFGGGKIEQLALAKYRRDLWQGRVSNSHHSDAELRKNGKCPLTPEEVGLMLAGLGFGTHTRLYLASYKVYGGWPRMAALHSLFPILENKYSLTTDEEISSFKGKASRLAALDYYVCMQSDVFISASPGNMHNALVGHRTYKGVKKTVRPNMSLLPQLFSNSSIHWTAFEQKVKDGHRQRLGQVKLRQVGQSLYTYPAPDCLCQKGMSV